MTVEELLKQLEEERRMLLEMAASDFDKMKECLESNEIGTAVHYEHMCSKEQNSAFDIQMAINVIKERVS